MNNYEIHQQLDKGSYGIVYRAMRLSDKVQVAIKQFKLLPDVDTSRIIKREASMLSKLKSQHVVDLLQVFVVKDRTYFVFQYLQKNLLDFMQEHRGAVSQESAKKIIYQLLKTLAFIHKKQCVHRDLKPENILLTQEHVKLCDFGFCREIQKSMTDYVATRWYRAPQLLLGLYYSKEVDIWALGCIFAQMLQGRPLFSGENDLDQIFLINRALGPLTKKQRFYFDLNPDFKGSKLPSHKNQFTLQSLLLKSVSKEGIEVLKIMLNVDPQQRESAQRLLKTQYFSRLNAKQHEEKHHISDYQNIASKLAIASQLSMQLKQRKKISMAKSQIHKQLAMKGSLPLKQMKLVDAQNYKLRLRLPSLHSRWQAGRKDVTSDPRISLIHKIYSNNSRNKNR